MLRFNHVYRFYLDESLVSMSQLVKNLEKFIRKGSSDVDDHIVYLSFHKWKICKQLNYPNLDSNKLVEQSRRSWDLLNKEFLSLLLDYLNTLFKRNFPADVINSLSAFKESTAAPPLERSGSKVEDDTDDDMPAKLKATPASKEKAEMKV